MTLSFTAKKYISKFPPIGLRLIKSAVAVFICLIIYLLRGQQGIPFYSAISALSCMQAYIGTSKNSAKERTFGTFNGAFWGGIILIINTYVITDSPMMWKYMLVSVTIIIVIYTAVVLGKQSVSYFSCVVFLSITIIHLTDNHPYVFVFNRVLDTMIGIFVSIVINYAHLPRKYNNDILFVSGLDDSLINYKEQMSAYSKVELNRIINNGALFTISTERTTASLMDAVKDIKLNLPVIAFNGAVLFDIKKKEYPRKRILESEVVTQIQNLFADEQVACFTTALLQDNLQIYYNDFYNSVEEEIFNKLRISPYRNYIKGNVAPEAESFYLMCVDTQEHIAKIYYRLKKLPINSSIRMVRMLSRDYPGFTYLKIYHKEATKQNMLIELKKMISVEKSVTLGTINGQYDILVNLNKYDMVVKKIKKIYEPCKWVHKAK
jgi:hydroxymethylpyrimidine pyrophosphatase-like HAD family hydrolase